MNSLTLFRRPIFTMVFVTEMIISEPDPMVSHSEMIISDTPTTVARLETLISAKDTAFAVFVPAE
jgi:hypothetical protein